MWCGSDGRGGRRCGAGCRKAKIARARPAVVQGHRGRVTAMVWGEGLLYTCGHDGFVRAWQFADADEEGASGDTVGTCDAADQVAFGRVENGRGVEGRNLAAGTELEVGDGAGLSLVSLSSHTPYRLLASKPTFLVLRPFAHHSSSEPFWQLRIRHHSRRVLKA